MSLRENAIGKVCTYTFSDRKAQNRCKALNHLWDTATSGAKAVGACAVTAGAAPATVASLGLAAPVGVAAAGSCAYNGASMLDSAWAMGTQLRDGEEKKSYKQQAKESAGAWVKRKLKAMVGM